MAKTPGQRDRRAMTATLLFAVAGGMVGLAFASVPLYELFCKVTGFGGTPRTENVVAVDRVGEGTMIVRFDANVSSSLPWQFRPEQRQVQVVLGEERLVHYVAANRSDRPVTGTATFNVTPYKAARYFNKVDCFCFTEQHLEAGEAVPMPVVFFIDPAIRDDPDTRDVTRITLSYTFFRVEPKQDQAKTAREMASAK